uniref:Unannotated protein n=1 Tax=freshwater metagenome TaxID=449393 RepID=A0A6J6A1J5_9ZZZZ
MGDKRLAVRSEPEGEVAVAFATVTLGLQRRRGALADEQPLMLGERVDDSALKQCPDIVAVPLTGGAYHSATPPRDEPLNQRDIHHVATESVTPRHDQDVAALHGVESVGQGWSVFKTQLAAQLVRERPD